MALGDLRPPLLVGQACFPPRLGDEQNELGQIDVPTSVLGSYGPNSHGLYRYGLYMGGLAYIVMANAVTAYIVMAIWMTERTTSARWMVQYRS